MITKCGKSYIDFSEVMIVGGLFHREHLVTYDVFFKSGHQIEVAHNRANYEFYMPYNDFIARWKITMGEDATDSSSLPPTT